ncbi:type 4a pilus biogenesis protein PilO [Candidatus Daviesbacteria bacterium]|nr:type 4a pilus biogenesis protein PilO [Candidatus Daviesbacteria bacterium]
MRGESTKYSRYFTYIKPVAKLPIIRTYGTTIFTLLVIAIFIFFAIKPTVETILLLQKKLENSQQVLEKVKKKSADLTKAKESYDNLGRDIKDKIETAIPSHANLKSLIQTLEDTARLHNASISALQIQPITLEVKKNTGIGELAQIDFTFNSAGSYENLVSLLQDLKTSSRLVSIEKVSINEVEESGGLIISIIGKGHYIK